MMGKNGVSEHPRFSERSGVQDPDGKEAVQRVYGWSGAP